MKIIVNNIDITEIVVSIIWSGDTKSVARKLIFSMIYKDTDYYLPKPELNEGDLVLLQDDESATIFGGILFDIEKSGASNTISYTAFDFMYYVNKYEMSKVFDAKAETIVSDICTEIGVDVGSIEQTNTQIYLPAFSKTAYEIIMMAYTAVSRQNGKKYIPLIQDIDKLSVIEKGISSNVILDSSYNITDSTYNTSLQNMINRVLIVDETGATINKVEDINSMSKYGTIQKIYKEEDGKNSYTEATSYLCDIEQTASITALSDIRAVSGYSIIIQEPISGLYGLFYIESDTHRFENGKSIMQLTLEFENIMDEKEIDTNT